MSNPLAHIDKSRCAGQHIRLITDATPDPAVLALPAFNATKFQDIGDAAHAIRLHILKELERMAVQLLHEGSLVNTVSVKLQDNLFALRTSFSRLHTQVGFLTHAVDTIVRA